MNEMQKKIFLAQAEKVYRELPSYAKKIQDDILSLEELEELDSFNVLDNDEGLTEAVRKYKGFAIPPLREGVLKFSTSYFPMYVRWKVFSSDVEYEVYVIANGVARYLHSAICHQGQDEVSVVTASDILKEALPKLLPRDREILRMFLPGFEAFNNDSLNSLGETTCVAFFAAMNWFNDLLDTHDDTERIRAELNHEAVHYGFRKVGNEKRRVIYLNGAKVECGKNTQVSVRRGFITRKTDVWGVRGHYRHYQNGKVIYIDPYEKGINRNTGKKRVPKEYKVNQ